MFSTAENCKEKLIILLKYVVSHIGKHLRPSNNFRQMIFNINAVVLLRSTKMVKCLPDFEYFTVFLKNRNFISKIKRSYVTDYAALSFSAV